MAFVYVNTHPCLLYQRARSKLRGNTLREIIFTSNQTFIEWGKLFSNPARANAAIDRATHHGHTINIEGESYRMKDKLAKLKSITP